jgi:iron(III) transport system ATP-binding protein
VDAPINVYTKPANRFIFSFIGLSNFLPVVVKNGTAYIEGAESAGSMSQEIPPDMREDRMVLACRPSEVNLQKEGGVKAIVKRKVYLGDIIDYRIMIGTTEVRVQKNRRSAYFAEGDTCCLTFNRPLWYPHE